MQQDAVPADSPALDAPQTGQYCPLPNSEPRSGPVSTMILAETQSSLPQICDYS